MGTRPRLEEDSIHRAGGLRRARETVGSALFALAVLILATLAGTPFGAEAETPMPPAVARADVAVYADAFRAAARDNWRRAHRLARRAGDPLGATILRWWDFSRPDTPRLVRRDRAVHRRAPRLAGPESAPDQCRSGRSRTAFPMRMSSPGIAGATRSAATGGCRYADALVGAGKSDRAAALVRAAWIEDSFGARELRETWRRYRSLLRPEDHVARLDRLVWANHGRAARRMFRYVDEGYQRLAQARLTLRARASGVDWADRASAAGAPRRPGARLRAAALAACEGPRRRRARPSAGATATARPAPQALVAGARHSGAPRARGRFDRGGLRPRRRSQADPRPPPFPRPSGWPGGLRSAFSTMPEPRLVISHVCTAR